MRCPKCQAENSETIKFCGECGTQLTQAEPVQSPASPADDISMPTKTIEAVKEELTTGATFARRYQIIEELGRGGMGRVYKAMDTEINEKVALKLITPEIAKDKKTIERFRNELKFARKIRHKNVCQMYDLSKEEESYYITMEYVRGDDLKGMIRRMGGFSAGQAITIAKQVCNGLAEAHKLGVIHRDLKPQNIMIDQDGNARIMDFGIARSLKGRGITGAGVMIGTPEYMSPEQVEGKETDQRSDIYSLGVILFEMVTGQTPFQGNTPFTIGVKHKSEIPQNPQELNNQISVELSHIILRCLEKDKEKRFQSAGELRQNLQNIEKGLSSAERVIPKVKPTTSKEVTVSFHPKKVVISALIVIALAAAIIIMWQTLLKKKSTFSLPAVPTIALLPFQDLSPQKDQEIFCESISEYIISKLTKLKELKVIQGDSAMHFKDTQKSPQSIGKELRVDVILYGSVQRSGDNVRVFAKLMNVRDASLIWSEILKESEGDVLDIQSTIALQIAAHLQTELSSDDKEQIKKRPTENIEAYFLFQRGRYFWRKRGEENIRKSIKYLKQAIAIDLNFALAYAGLADSYSSLFWRRPLEEAIKIKENALKALALDNTLAEAHTALAHYRLEHEWDFKGAKQEFKQAIALNPGYALAHHGYGRYYWWTGETDKAIAEQKLAQGMDPLSPSINRMLASYYIIAEEYDLAFEALNRVIEIDPNHYQIHSLFGSYYLGKSMYEEALDEYTQEFGPDSLARQFWEQVIQTRRGKLDKAREFIERIEEQANWEGIISPFYMALFWSILGETEKVFFYLHKAYKEHDMTMLALKTIPSLDDYRSDPRYEQLLKKMGLN